MRKLFLAGAAVLAIAGSTVVYAQHVQWSHDRARWSAEDRTAFADAKIAAVHAGLKLTPDQEKLWPPVEGAVRDFAKLRIDRANARMNDAGKDTSKPDDKNAQGAPQQAPDDPVARLRMRADTMATTAAALKRIADAADPLYKTLDDGQKRRLALLTHQGGRFGGGGWRQREFEHGGMDRGMDRGYQRGRDGDDQGRGFGRDGGFHRDGGQRRDRDDPNHL
jgi:hypothetical protein